MECGKVAVEGGYVATKDDEMAGGSEVATKGSGSLYLDISGDKSGCRIGSGIGIHSYSLFYFTGRKALLNFSDIFDCRHSRAFHFLPKMN